MELANDELHVWSLSLADSLSPEMLMMLSAGERDKAARFRFDRDRARFVICRSGLRMLLSRYLDRPPEALSIETARFGKPFVSDTDLRFNVSHSSDRALVAVTRGTEVGVDLESVQTNLDPLSLAHPFFSPGERAFVENARPEDRIIAFLTCWTHKEAWMKAVGVGLSEPTSRFDVSGSLPIDGSNELVDHEIATRWFLHRVSTAEPFIAAVVTGESRRLSFFDWPRVGQ
jgi:4'-phosphopantetheinyl transferase